MYNGGVPNSIRSFVWTSLTDASVSTEKNPGVYEVWFLVFVDGSII